MYYALSSDRHETNGPVQEHFRLPQPEPSEKMKLVALIAMLIALVSVGHSISLSFDTRHDARTDR